MDSNEQPNETGANGFSHFFHIDIDDFRGPIDLLLHLVKQSELEIEKVSLAQVAEQYLQFVESMKHLDLDLVGEYLVIAATLLSIKSSILLDEPVELVPDEDGNLIDPHEELLRKLREAAIYKDGAEYLQTLDQLGQDVFQSAPHLRHVGRAPVPFKEHDPLLLGKAFRKLLEKADHGNDTYTVTMESVSVVQRMVEIVDQLRESGDAIPFEEVIPDLSSRAALIGSFIALLELCKRQVIVVKQDESFEQILIGLASDNVELGEITSEFDTAEEQEKVTANV